MNEDQTTKSEEYLSEDDDLRSEFIRNLIQNQSSIEKFDNHFSIPKVIIQYWHDLDNLPDDVNDCLTSWEPNLGRGFKRKLFDDSRAIEFIKSEFGEPYVTAYKCCHHPAMRSDYFRLCYMLLNGGMYVDADEFYLDQCLDFLFQNNLLKLQPLSYDVSSNSMIDPKVFMQKENKSRNWIFYVNNNPLVGPPNHPLIDSALKRATNTLLTNLDNGTTCSDIQSTTGPGNLSACLVKHSITIKSASNEIDFQFIKNWDSISQSKWPLSYRNDERNWRLWNPSDSKVDFFK